MGHAQYLIPHACCCKPSLTLRLIENFVYDPLQSSSSGFCSQTAHFTLVMSLKFFCGTFVNLNMLIIMFQVTRLREYQGVDQDFDESARRYHDLVTVSSDFTEAHCSGITPLLCYFAKVQPNAGKNNLVAETDF